MEEKKILDLMISERIDALLGQMRQISGSKRKEEDQLVKQAEALLKQMPREEWTILTRCMDHQTDRLAEEGTSLYSCGFTDGIRLVKYIGDL